MKIIQIANSDNDGCVYGLGDDGQLYFKRTLSADAGLLRGYSSWVKEPMVSIDTSTPASTHKSQIEYIRNLSYKELATLFVQYVSYSNASGVTKREGNNSCTIQIVLPGHPEYFVKITRYAEPMSLDESLGRSFMKGKELKLKPAITIEWSVPENPSQTVTINSFPDN